MLPLILVLNSLISSWDTPRVFIAFRRKVCFWRSLSTIWGLFTLRWWAYRLVFLGVWFNDRLDEVRWISTAGLPRLILNWCSIRTLELTKFWILARWHGELSFFLFKARWEITFSLRLHLVRHFVYVLVIISQGVYSPQLSHIGWWSYTRFELLVSRNLLFRHINLSYQFLTLNLLLVFLIMVTKLIFFFSVVFVKHITMITAKVGVIFLQSFLFWQ